MPGHHDREKCCLLGAPTGKILVIKGPSFLSSWDLRNAELSEGFFSCCIFETTHCLWGTESLPILFPDPCSRAFPLVIASPISSPTFHNPASTHDSVQGHKCPRGEDTGHAVACADTESSAPQREVEKQGEGCAARLCSGLSRGDLLLILLVAQTWALQWVWPAPRSSGKVKSDPQNNPKYEA